MSPSLTFLGAVSKPPRMTYIVHGEPEAAALRHAVTTELGWQAAVAEDGHRVPL